MRLLCCLLLCCSASAAGLRVRSSDTLVTEAGNTVGSFHEDGGVAIGRNDVLTCWHVVDLRQIEVEIAGKWYVAETMRKDVKLDLAIVRVSSYLTPVKLVDCPKTTVEGSASGGAVKEQSAEITGGIVAYSPAQGHSGAPVMMGDKLAGMVTCIDSAVPPKFATFVSASVLRKFVEGE